MVTRKIRTTLSIIIGIIIMLLLSALLFSLFTMHQMKENLVIQVNTRTILLTLKDNLTSLLNAETGERGYVISGDTTYLPPYYLALENISSDTAQLRTLIKDNPVQQKNLDMLEHQINLKLDYIANIVSLKMKGDEVRVKEILLTKKGKYLMDSIRNANNLMQNIETKFYAERLTATQKSISKAKTIFIIEGIFSLLITLFLAYTIFNELNRRTRTEQKINAVNLDLERSNTELSSFSYVASHDLQEPLRKIQGFSKRILDAESASLSDKAKDYFNRINAAAQRMQNLIESLLSFSRSNITEINFVKTDLNKTLSDVEDVLIDIVTKKNAIIESQTLPTLNAVPVQMHQLFLNLISNAIKYSKADVAPHIKITAEKVTINEVTGRVKQNGAFWKIIIADNGIGFEQKYEHKIFELFQRLHGKNEYEGTGIGLAICKKKILHSHNGIISATGQLNIGSTFTFFLSDNNKS